MAGDRRHIAAVVLLLALLGSITLLFVLVPSLRKMVSREQLLGIVRRAGFWAPALLIAIMALAVVLSPLPNVPIAAVLGMVYGPWWGTAIAVAGGILGATLAFEVARHLGGGAIRALAGKPIHFCDGCKDSTLSTLVLVSRLIPVVSFDVVSYGAGLSHMSFWKFVLYSFLGMLPWTWFYTAFGAAVFDQPVTAGVLGIVLAAVILLLPVVVRRYNPWGLRSILMEQKSEEVERNDG